jgi:hypothetical protein
VFPIIDEGHGERLAGYGASNASVNGKDAHCLSVCATAMRYDERSVSEACLEKNDPWLSE